MKSLKEVYGMGSKKLTARGLRKLIKEEIQMLEDADPAKVDDERFPLKLSQAAAKADQAEILATGGTNDGAEGDDEVQASKAELPVSQLKPSQTSMNIDKAIAMVIAALRKVDPFPGGPGGDLGAIITSDNHIMDGHHRWIASGMVNPASKVGGYVVEFPAKQMIAALNMITVKLGITQGKEGTGDFGQFKEPGIKAALEKVVAEGTWSGNSEEATAAIEEWTGAEGDAAIDAAAAKMAENIDTLNTDVPGDFPTRPDMPVISYKKGHLDKAIELLRTGAVDLNEPYAKEGEEGEGEETKKESRHRNDRLIMERWKRLAGLL